MLFLVALLSGLFVGSQVENKLNNPALPPGGGAAASNNDLPVYVKVPLIVGGSFAAILLVRGVIKKAKIF